MGLAASQCRLLFLTSRQSDLSAKMQRISMDKIRLSRESDKISAQYDQMLTATKLVAKDGVDLSYEGLMGTGAYANGTGTPQFITSMSEDTYGRVVLAGSLKNALAPVLRAETGDGRDFEEKIQTAADLQEILEPTMSVTPTGGTSGTGGDSGNTAIEKAAWLEEVEAFVAQKGEWPTKAMTSNAGVVGSGDLGNTHLGFLTDKTNLSDLLNGYDSGASASWYQVSESQSTAISSTKSNIQTLSDELVAMFCNSLGFTDQQKQGAKSCMQSYVDDLKNAVNSPVGGPSTSLEDTAISWAKSRAQSGFIGYCKEDKQTFLGVQTDPERHYYCINRSELARRVFVKFCEIYGGQSPAKNGETAKTDGTSLTQLNSNLSDVALNIQVNDHGYTQSAWRAALESLFNAQGYTNYTSFAIALEDAKGVNGSGDGGAGGGDGGDEGGGGDPSVKPYYTALWNKLKTVGWVYGDVSSVMTNLQNGTYYLNGTTLTNNSDLFEEVADEDAQKRADRWYDREKDKIKRKEDIMTIEMEKLNTEYSAVTNDYNSVKAIIQQNVEKSFKYCQSG